MSWFKKLSIARRASQNKSFLDTTSKEKANRGETSTTCRSNESRSTTTECDCKEECSRIHEIPTRFHITPEIVDPDEFFEDPYHVQMYRDEREFLDIISDWVIVADPRKAKAEENFFSADFEAEFISVRQSTSQASVVNEDLFKVYERSCPEHDNNNTTSSSSLTIISLENVCQACEELALDTQGDYQFFWGHWVQTGCILSPFTPNHGNSNKSIGHHSVLERAKRNRKRILKKQHSSLDNSIMSAIKGPCSTGKSLNNVSDHSDLVNNQDDVLDVEVLFGLDDNGNIILDTEHIQEEKGYGFLMCRTKKLYRSIKKGKEVGESFLVRKSILKFLKEFASCLSIFLACCHPRNKSQCGGPEDSVRAYTLQLANDHSSTFSRNIENFIACTKESREAAPQVVMRNMRQFMSGMKNYLVKHGEGDFHQEVQKARSRLKSDEFLNLDAILEAVMHQLVVLPLREHLYGLFVDYYTRTGDIQLLVQNVKYACARSAPEFGIRPGVAPPSSPSLAQIGVLLVRLQEAELPLEKLELFLCVISTIFDATGCPRGQQLGADDFLPTLVYVVAKCGFVGAEIEAEYMWGLLQPALLNGEAGYYLTALCSAVHVLKSFIGSENEGTGSLDVSAIKNQILSTRKTLLLCS